MTPTTPFQVVLYLARNSHAFPERELNLCESYAKAFNWAVSLIVVDDEATTKGPEHRPMLQAALQRLRDNRAGAILVPSKCTISPIDGEFNEFAEHVEKASAFIQVATPR
ncbi:recombinase family protein [Streptomyces sp. FH025]|uniref:recombinase family protein n=1 Tax=Streptomyces sp. FH025 TaxID=2815937 RepID=UPI001A9FBC4C|nr:recombinase family protein [Streptomyces sp. FH025]MBO1417354.1 recombinase family protein [Streptomyces sp. FH025]